MEDRFLVRRLSRFTAALITADDVDASFAAIPVAVREVLPADSIILALVDQSAEDDRLVVRATYGARTPLLGSILDPSEPSLHALATGVTTVRPIDPPGDGSAASFTQPIWSAAAPLLRESSLIGLLSLERHDRDFDGSEREVLTLIADLLTVAINGWLRTSQSQPGQTTTIGLASRAQVDAAMAQLLASRREQPAAERLPLSAVIFELDGGTHQDNGRRATGVQRLTAIVLTRLRTRDVVCSDGDRVLALLPGTEPAYAERVASETLRAARAAFGYEDGRVIRAGCGAVDEGSDAPLAAAEAALVMARAVGGDTVIRA